MVYEAVKVRSELLYKSKAKELDQCHLPLNSFKDNEVSCPGLL